MSPLCSAGENWAHDWELVEQEKDTHVFLFADLGYNLRTYSMERALVAKLVHCLPYSSG